MTTTTEPTAPTVDQSAQVTPAPTLERLQGELDKMLEPLDIPRTWTQREVNAYEARRSLLNTQIGIVRNAQQMLDEVEPQIATLTAQRDDLVAIRAELETEIVSATEHKVFEKLHWLTVSIRIIDNQFDIMNELIPERGIPLFEKLRARKYGTPGHWNPMASLYGSLPTIEVRLKDLVKRRDEAQQRLSGVS